MSRLLIAASGTGGHLFPAWQSPKPCHPLADPLAGVPDRLEHPGARALRAGDRQSRWSPGQGLRKLIQLIQLIAASRDVRRLIRRSGSEVVFTTGGYIATPQSWRPAGAGAGGAA